LEHPHQAAARVAEHEPSDDGGRQQAYPAERRPPEYAVRARAPGRAAAQHQLADAEALAQVVDADRGGDQRAHLRVDDHTGPDREAFD
jgi:hypothetical protein